MNLSSGSDFAFERPRKICHPTDTNMTNELRLDTMISTTVFRRSAVLLLGVTAFGVVPAVSSCLQRPRNALWTASAPVVSTSRLRRHASSTNRSVDANGSVTIPVVDVDGVPAEGVLAVAVNITIAGATSNGFALGCSVGLRRNG